MCHDIKLIHTHTQSRRIFNSVCPKKQNITNNWNNFLKRIQSLQWADCMLWACVGCSFMIPSSRLICNKRNNYVNPSILIIPNLFNIIQKELILLMKHVLYTHHMQLSISLSEQNVFQENFLQRNKTFNSWSTISFWVSWILR